MKRLGLILTVVSILAIAAPAYAQTAPSAAITAPGDGAVVEGTSTVRATGSAATGVKRIKLFIEGSLVASKEPSELRQDVDIEYAWDTASEIDGSAISRNGWNQIKVVVVDNGGAEAQKTRNVRVDNPAAAPTGFNVTAGEGKVTMSWDANPEPDIQGYWVEVYRDDNFVTVGTTIGTSFAYETKAGTYTWQVRALRSSIVYPDGSVSDPSLSISRTVKAPPSETRGHDGSRKVIGDKKIYGGTTTKEARRTLRATARRFASGGISSAGISLPGSLIGLPRLPDNELQWGTYKEKLPYGMPATDPGTIEEFPVRYAAQSTSLVPPDGLRWVAAGLLLVVMAALLQFLASQFLSQVEKKEQAV